MSGRPSVEVFASGNSSNVNFRILVRTGSDEVNTAYGLVSKVTDWWLCIDSASTSKGLLQDADSCTLES